MLFFSNGQIVVCHQIIQIEDYQTYGLKQQGLSKLCFDNTLKDLTIIGIKPKVIQSIQIKDLKQALKRNTPSPTVAYQINGLIKPSI